MSPLSLPPVATTLTVVAWPDPVIDALGHDPRSHYVETFWLGILGPSTTWLLRRVAAGLESAPDGYQLDLAETARSLGLGDRGGRHSPFVRALGRCVQFELAHQRGPLELAVRRRLPPLNRRQVLHLSASLQERHQSWQEGQARLPSGEPLRRRARQLALSLLELGEDIEAAERQLTRWSFHPALAREAAAWAWDRHQTARQAARRQPGQPGSSSPGAAGSKVPGEAGALPREDRCRPPPGEGPVSEAAG